MFWITDPNGVLGRTVRVAGTEDSAPDQWRRGGISSKLMLEASNLSIGMNIMINGRS